MRHRRARHGRGPAAPSRCRSRRRPPTATADRLAVLAGARHARGSASACRASSTPRRARRSGRSAAPRSRRRWPDPGRRLPGAQHRPDLRHRRPDRGAPGGTRCDAALAWRPEELYLYPLYVRPLTGLGRARTPDGPTADWDAQRLRAVPAGPGPSAAPPATSRCRCGMFRRADAPRRGRRPTTAARTTAWSASAAAPVVHPRPALLVRLRGRAARRCGRIIDDYLRRPPADFARAEVRLRARRRRGAPPACSSRCCRPRAWTAADVPRAVRRRPAATTSPASWTARRARLAGPAPGRPAAADRRGPGALRRDRARAVLRRRPGRDGRVRGEVTRRRWT